MSEFKLTSSYEMSGDQPKAVDQLVDGVQRGDRFQTLLGATGTGKSVDTQEPVSVHLGGDRYYRGPIGQLIDSVLGPDQADESLEMTPPGAWRVLAWDARTGQTGWQLITGL